MQQNVHVQNVSSTKHDSTCHKQPHKQTHTNKHTQKNTHKQTHTNKHTKSITHTQTNKHSQSQPQTQINAKSHPRPQNFFTCESFIASLVCSTFHDRAAQHPLFLLRKSLLRTLQQQNTFTGSPATHVSSLKSTVKGSMNAELSYQFRFSVAQYLTNCESQSMMQN